MILCAAEFAEYVDKGCPLVLGGPLPHAIAAKAVAFTEANTPEFREYTRKIVTNAQTLAAACIDEGMIVATGGADNHLLLIDVRNFDLTGRQAESVLRECGMTLNRNALPFDPSGPWYTSGLRLGTPAVTTVGMGEAEMKEIAAIMKLVLANTKPALVESGKNAGKLSRAKYLIADAARVEAKARIKVLQDKFPVYPELDLAFLQAHF
jgi:glycine hydroxymethyltransferase